MKNVFVVTVSLFGLFLFGSNVWAQTPVVAVPHFYGLEHGVVEYEISGVVKGTEKLYFDQWGLRQSRHKVSQTQRWGTVNTVTLNLSGQIVIMDPNKNLGQKKEDQSLKQLLANWKADDGDPLFLRLLSLHGATKGKDVNFLDRVCEDWEMAEPKMKAWVWNGIPLKVEAQTPEGVVIYTAVHVDDAMVVDENLFVIPEQIHFINHDINEILIN